jgi:hypothetical protein
MGLTDWVAKKKMQRELKKWGLEDAELNIDVEGLEPEDIKKFQEQFKAFVKKHPKLEKLNLDSLPELMQHKEEIRELVEKNKEEFKKIISILEKEE